MSEAITATVATDALARLNVAFNDYLVETGKDPRGALITRGQFLSYNLYRAFSATAPAPGSIMAATVARGWRMGRRGVPSGISATTWKRVYAMMQGNKSILAYTVPSVGTVRPLRVGARGRFVTDRARVKGVATRANAVAAYRYAKGIRLSGMRSVGRAMGAKVLNRRAVAVALEMQLRERGRKFLGISWLHRRWREFAKIGFVPEGTPGLAAGLGPSRQFGGVERKLVNNNPRSVVSPLGVAEFIDAPNGAFALRITSNVPGIETERARGIIAGVLNEETMGIQAYLLRRSTARLNSALSTLSKQST